MRRNTHVHCAWSGRATSHMKPLPRAVPLHTQVPSTQASCLHHACKCMQLSSVVHPTADRCAATACFIWWHVMADAELVQQPCATEASTTPLKTAATCLRRHHATDCCSLPCTVHSAAAWVALAQHRSLPAGRLHQRLVQQQTRKGRQRSCTRPAWPAATCASSACCMATAYACWVRGALTQAAG